MTYVYRVRLLRSVVAYFSHRKRSCRRDALLFFLKVRVMKVLPRYSLRDAFVQLRVGTAQARYRAFAATSLYRTRRRYVYIHA